MRVLEKTRREIEEKLKTMSDFLKLEYLESCLKQFESIEIRKFACEKLAELYEQKSMLIEAAKNLDSLAKLVLTFKEKIKAHMKEAEVYIKAGLYNDADNAFKKALNNTNAAERNEIKNQLKELYLRQADALRKAGKNSNALKICEKILSTTFVELGDEQRQEIKKNLLFLYEKLGKIREYMVLKESLK